MRKTGLTMLVCVAALLVSCLRQAGPQRGGSATVDQFPVMGASGSVASSVAANNHAPPSASINQPDNPNSTSKQNVDYEFEEVVEVPMDTIRETSTSYPDGRVVIVKEPQPAGTRIIKRSKSKVNQELGGSWKDTAKQFAAELGAFASVQYVGIGVLLFGAASFFHPVLRKVVGGKDVAIAAGAIGSVMMFGPFFLVKYSNFFFLAILLLIGYWVLARLKYKEGRLDLLESNKPE